MNDQELLSMWKSYDEKLDEVLSLNKEIVMALTKDKLNDTIRSLRRPKRSMLLIGIPYTAFLFLITLVAYQAGGFFVTMGFGAIGMINAGIIAGYLYHLHLIRQISNSQGIVDVQTRIAKLKISSFKTMKLAVVQLPFWSICWMSLDALQSSPLLYGGLNLLVFLGLAYLAYWVYVRLNIESTDSAVGRFFLSGNEWEPIVKASKLLEQLKEYEG